MDAEGRPQGTDVGGPPGGAPLPAAKGASLVRSAQDTLRRLAGLAAELDRLRAAAEPPISTGLGVCADQVAALLRDLEAGAGDPAAVAAVAAEHGPADGGAGVDEGAAVVLVVEDDAELRALLTRIIGVAHRVVAVADAESALVAAPRLRPDVLMCDLSLPGVDGEELLRRLRADVDTADIPVMVVSGRADEASRVRLLHAGAVDYVTKPFLPGELRARVANVLAGRRDQQRLRARAQQADARAQQLQHALDTRVIVEQAKGVLAASYGVTIPVAYERLRRYARDRNRKLHDVARAVVADGLRP